MLCRACDAGGFFSSGHLNPVTSNERRLCCRSSSSGAGRAWIVTASPSRKRLRMVVTRNTGGCITRDPFNSGGDRQSRVAWSAHQQGRMHAYGKYTARHRPRREPLEMAASSRSPIQHRTRDARRSRASGATYDAYPTASTLGRPAAGKSDSLIIALHSPSTYGPAISGRQSLLLRTLATTVTVAASQPGSGTLEHVKYDQ